MASNKINAFNIDQFIGAYDDYARQYLFYCQINANVPGVSLDRDHIFLTMSTQLPQESVEEILTNWQGNAYKLGSTSTFDDFETTFKLPKDAGFRKELIKWKNKIHNPETNLHGNPADYMNATINLQLLNGNGDPIMVYKLNKCWPSVIGAVELGYENKEIVTFPVTWKYVYHTVEDL